MIAWATKRTRKVVVKRSGRVKEPDCCCQAKKAVTGDVTKLVKIQYSHLLNANFNFRNLSNANVNAAL